MNEQGISAAAASSTAQKIAVLLLLALLLASFALRCERIVDNAPYPRHVDEETFLKNSLGMLVRGSARPMTLNWPSLPIYLAAGAHWIGYAWDHDPTSGKGLTDIRIRAFPYYHQEGMVLAAKLLFAALSIATLCLVGLLARRITDSWLALIVAPGLLSLNALYLYHSWSYLNVDIVGSFFIVAGLTYLILWADDRQTLLHKAILPGIFCGLATACKYPNGALAIPFLISIAWSDWRKLPLQGGLLFFFLGLTFAIAMPYSVIETSRTLKWMAIQQGIYSGGWPGHTVVPGLPHLLRQLSHTVESYGLAIFALGLLGIVIAITRGGRKGVALASYPIFYTLYYSTFKVDIVRNLLAVQILFAIFATIGALTLMRALARWLSSTRVLTGRPDARFMLAAGLTIAGMALAAPWGAIRDGYFPPRDSRHVAVAWIQDNIPSGSRLVFARELRFDVRDLMTQYYVDIRPLMRKHGNGAVLRMANPEFLHHEAERGSYFIVPEYGWYDPWPDRAELAHSVNARLAGGERLASFGTHPVPVKYFETVPDGDPKFTIRRGDLLSRDLVD